MNSGSMLFLVVASILLGTPQGTIERDAYGVPKITANTPEDAYYWAGRAVAEDRLWQMEMSRRSARGKLAAVLGKSALESDRQVLMSAYSDEELETQFLTLSKPTRGLIDSYARGVTSVMGERKAAGTLPPGYASNGFEPEPWSRLDSLAIMVNMARLFGGGGQGELRNYALLQYLKAQPCKDRVLDVIDDLAWQNDPKAICTLSDADDPQRRTHIVFPKVERSMTERQLALIPSISLFELLPAIRLVNGDDAKAVALSHSVPFKTGSYCAVVAPNRSKENIAYLLSGPQMGHTEPAVIHEMSIQAGDLNITGLDVPGIPGVLVGSTPELAWGLTTGVLDNSDVFFFKTDGAGSYTYSGKKLPIEKIEFTIRVKGAEPVKVTQSRTIYGPVILESKGTKTVFSSRTTYWKREVSSLDSVYRLYSQKSTADFLKATHSIPVGFNVFCADRKGSIGWRYCGEAPTRAPHLDPRFPTPATAENDWRGMIPADKMPHVLNPASGLLLNWNNKPVSWWPNLDTPAWGRIFRNELLVRALDMPKVGVDDLERAIWAIARQDAATCGQFRAHFDRALAPSSSIGFEARGAETLGAFDTWQLEGSQPATLYHETVAALRRELFLKSTGNFTGEGLFATVVQPSVLLNALEGKTKYPYLGGRSRDAVVQSAFRSALGSLRARLGDEIGAWRWRPGGIAVAGQPPIPYSSRGSYIQIVELRDVVVGRSVLPPGISEAAEGGHRQDQVPLARAWTYKPMWGFR